MCKVRGRKQSLSKMTELLKEYLDIGKCEVAVLHVVVKKKQQNIWNNLKAYQM